MQLPNALYTNIAPPSSQTTEWATEYLAGLVNMRQVPTSSSERDDTSANMERTDVFFLR